MTAATNKQIDYLISLHNRVHGTKAAFLGQCKTLNLTMRERSGNITKVRASMLIEDLRAELERQEREAEKAEEQAERNATLADLLPEQPTQLATVKDLAHWLQVSDGAIRKLRADGMPTIMIGRFPRFDIADVTNWLKERS